MKLTDDRTSAIIAHYSSFKSNRITRNVLAALLFAVLHAFISASTKRLAVNIIIRGQVSQSVIMDLKSLFEKVGRISIMIGKLPMISLTLFDYCYRCLHIFNMLGSVPATPK